MVKSYKAFIKEYSMGLQVPSTSYLKGVGSLRNLTKKETSSVNTAGEGGVPARAKSSALSNGTPLKRNEAITLDKVKIKATAWFKSLVTKIKMMTTTQKRYEYAAKVLQDVIDRKKKERAIEGLPLRHDIGYYASAVADTFRDIDDKKLQRMVHEETLQTKP